ncbi:MAG: SH3 domain-containing protein [Patescibacteria group bacterium]
MKSLIYALILSFAFAGVSFISPNTAQASGCYVDPVWARSWTGVINTGARVRDGACMEGSTVLTTLAVGTSVNIIAETDGWYKVKLPNGTKGWVGAWLISVTGKDSTTNVRSSESSRPEGQKVVTDLVKTLEPVIYDAPISNVLTERVKGYILLQVESVGEAWYVHPEDGKRYYMKDGAAAYNMMRYFGLGVSNKDMSKIQAGDWTLRNRLRGKIVLQVELHGEAYYIHPKDATVHYLKDGKEAYRIMRELSLGITNKDLSVLPTKNFDSYIAEREAKIVAAIAPVPVGDGSINLTGSVQDGKVYVNWVVNGVDVPMGFKIVKSEDPNPVYPGDTYHYYSETNKRSDTWSGLSGTYHFRVCQYLGGACGVYSNDIELSL